MVRLWCRSTYPTDCKANTPWTVRFKTITPDHSLETQPQLRNTRTKDSFSKIHNPRRAYSTPHIMLRREDKHPTIIDFANFIMDEYKVIKHLGEGGFGQVVLAQERTTKQVSNHVPMTDTVAGVS
jgi:hypothetical protein